MKKTVFSIILLITALICHAQKVVSVSGEYRYLVPENVSITDAKNIAIEKARNEAMAAEFGTLVSQTSTNMMKTVDGKLETEFVSIGGAESKGIWLGDTKEPEVKVLFENDVMVVEAKVWGKAREIKNSETDLEIKILCNGIESERFKDKDTFSIDFKSASKGYVAIFLRDDILDDPVFCLMPYNNENGEPREVKGNTVYTFLSKKDPHYPLSMEKNGKTYYMPPTTLTTEKDVEYNTIIIVFSKNQFGMPLSEKGEFVDEIDVDKFQKWLRKNRLNDETMQVIEKTVEIRKK
ncbi:MAG: hypothetical protein IKS65_00255 [Bacteroidales bacterium]|nr:hypothetical protein [Bacteroidales bacterium]